MRQKIVVRIDCYNGCGWWGITVDRIEKKRKSKKKTKKKRNKNNKKKEI